MAVLDLQGVETDYCLDCGGSWIDRAELALLLNGRLDINFQSFLYGSTATRRRCPICRKRLRESRFKGTDIAIDVCPLAHGLWFDRGELKAVMRDGAHRDRIGTLSSYFEDALSPETQPLRRSP